MQLLLALATSILFFLLPTSVFADSKQTYQDYLYQYDRYRESLNEFKVARAEYLKFKTLVSEQTALEKTKTMLQKRDDLLRAYLLFLADRLTESPALTDTNRTLYQKLISNEVTFLETHSKLIPSVGSLTDAEEVSKQLSSHHNILQANIRQTIVALTYGDIAKADMLYQDIVNQSTSLLQQNRSSYPPEKQSTMDRWLLQIQNKRSLYAQKIDAAMTGNNALKGSSVEEIDSLFQTIKRNLSEAKQYLLEGTSFIGELRDSMRYIN